MDGCAVNINRAESVPTPLFPHGLLGLGLCGFLPGLAMEGFELWRNGGGSWLTLREIGAKGSLGARVMSGLRTVKNQVLMGGSLSHGIYIKGNRVLETESHGGL